ncbi:MAG: hypothetical protein JKY56_18470 [Kofleriaceae bacterium]|nr:hypothetical protein [Kofleriaceae bacterium]
MQGILARFRTQYHDEIKVIGGGSPLLPSRGQAPPNKTLGVASVMLTMRAADVPDGASGFVSFFALECTQ